MTMRSRLELAVGIFIIIGLIVFVSFVFLIRDFQIIKPGYRFDIVFGFANGLKISTPTRLAGVDVGEVQGIKIFYDPVESKTKVRVRVWVREDAKIPKDSKVWINTLGLLGEKYIEIIPGRNYDPLVKGGDVLIGEDPVAMEEITEKTKELVLKIEESINGLNYVLEKIKAGEGTIGKFVNDETVYKNIQDLSDDLRRHPWKLFWKTKEKPAKK